MQNSFDAVDWWEAVVESSTEIVETAVREADMVRWDLVRGGVGDLLAVLERVDDKLEALECDGDLLGE